MADYDLAASLKPVLGTAAAAAMQGAVFTPWIDTTQHKSIVFLANISAAAQYDAVSWTMQESEDNGTTSNAVSADEVIEYKPEDETTTSQVFHVGYRGKKRYVRAAFDDGAAATGQISGLLGHYMSGPVGVTFQQAIEQ
jgi:hypothetical protein